MQDYIVERIKSEANFIVENKSTVRAVAKSFGLSKSTIHRDLTKLLPTINPALAEKVREVLSFNTTVRHIRGGIATKRRWQHINGYVKSMEEFNKC